MLVDNIRAAAIKDAVKGLDNGDLIWQAINDLLADRQLLFVLLAHEQGELTEKQAADILGVDRLVFRMAAIEADGVIGDATRVRRSPGQPGSWGRTAIRSWECDFDPTGGGCECAGGGMMEYECRSCYYRPTIGEKK